jgi:hypothetical protein
MPDILTHELFHSTFPEKLSVQRKSCRENQLRVSVENCAGLPSQCQSREGAVLGYEHADSGRELDFPRNRHIAEAAICRDPFRPWQAGVRIEWPAFLGWTIYGWVARGGAILAWALAR